jgi:hypothetical protein
MWRGLIESKRASFERRVGAPLDPLIEVRDTALIHLIPLMICACGLGSIASPYSGFIRYHPTRTLTNHIHNPQALQEKLEELDESLGSKTLTKQVVMGLVEEIVDDKAPEAAEGEEKSEDGDAGDGDDEDSKKLEESSSPGLPVGVGWCVPFLVKSESTTSACVLDVLPADSSYHVVRRGARLQRDIFEALRELYAEDEASADDGDEAQDTGEGAGERRSCPFLLPPPCRFPLHLHSPPSLGSACLTACLAGHPRSSIPNQLTHGPAQGLRRLRRIRRRGPMARDQLPRGRRAAGTARTGRGR